MPSSGHKVGLFLTGTATVMTGESMTLVSGLVYKIDDAAKEIWDFANATVFVIKDGGAPVSGTLNRLEGKVTLDAAPGGAVTIDGKFLPRVEFACANSFTVSRTNDLLDKTCMKLTGVDAGVMRKFLGLKDASFNVGHIEYDDVFGEDEIMEILYGRRSFGTITTVAKASLVDGETFVLTDGKGNVSTFEFDDNAAVGGGNVAIDLTLLVTADDVRDAVIAAINGVDGLLVVASDGGAALVDVEHSEFGDGLTETVITEAVVDAGFLVTGFSGAVEEVVKVFEVQIGTAPTQRIRAFVLMESREISAETDGRLEDSLSFVLAGQQNESYSFEV